MSYSPHQPTASTQLPWSPVYAPATPVAQADGAPMGQQHYAPAASCGYLDYWRQTRVVWWRPLLLVIAVGAVWFFATMIASFSAIAVDMAIGRDVSAMTQGEVSFTSALFTANNISLGLLVPLVMVLAWAIIGQRPGLMSSVFGHFRWGWALRAAMIIVPMLLLWNIGQQYLAGAPQLKHQPWTAYMIVVVLLTTPFQAAGEEYLCRGLLTRAVASWIPHKRVGLILAWAVSTAVFVTIHFAEDLWLNIFYATFATCAVVLTWQTRGLEAAVMLHVVNNVSAEWTLPFTDFSGMMDRSSGTGSPWMLLDMAWIVLMTGVVVWSYRRQHRQTL